MSYNGYRKGIGTQPALRLASLVRRYHRSQVRHRQGRGGVVPMTRTATRVLFKAAVHRNRGTTRSIAAHIRYLAREARAAGVERPSFYGPAGPIQSKARQEFAERARSTRHHFRLILSPEVSEGLDLTAFTQQLMGKAESDLGTRLDWMAVNHFDTAHPHTHVVVQGVDEQGQDLVVRRDYFAHGMRQRAQLIASIELPLPSPLAERGLDLAPLEFRPHERKKETVPPGR